MATNSAANSSASLVMVPLVARGKFLGMLVAGNLEEHAYTTDEKRLLDGLGELASMAITNAELYRIARKTLDALSRERGVAGSVLEEMVAARKGGFITVWADDIAMLAGFVDFIGGNIRSGMTLLAGIGFSSGFH